MNGAEVRSRVLDGTMTSVPLYSIHAANAIFALCGFNVDLDSIEWRELLSTCAWRIADLRPEFVIFFACLTCGHARSHYSPRPPHHHRFPTRRSRRSTLGGCRVRSHEASVPDRESLAWPCPKHLRVGSADRRILFTMDKADSPCAGGHRFKTVNATTFPSGSGPAKASAAVFAKASSQAWAKRPQPGRTSRRC